MKQFKLKENGFKEIRKQALIKAIPIILITLIVGLGISFFIPIEKNISFIIVLPFISPIIIGAAVFGLYKGLKRQEAIFNSYVLKIDKKSIISEQINTPAIKLLFTEITKISKSVQGGIVITGSSKYNTIIVPAQIDDMAGFENLLNENCKIKIILSKQLIHRLLIPFVLTVLGLMAVTYISTNKILVTCSGTILTAIMIWSFISIQLNKNIDKKTKRNSYFLIIVILSIIGLMIIKLFNPITIDDVFKYMK